MRELRLHIAPKTLSNQCDYIGMSENFRCKKDVICQFLSSIWTWNKQKIRISAIEDFVVEATKEIEKNFQNVVGQDSLTRFDQKPKKKNNKNKKRRKPTNFKNGPKKE